MSPYQSTFNPADNAERSSESRSAGRLDNVDRVGLFKEAANERKDNGPGGGGGNNATHLEFKSPYGSGNGHPDSTLNNSQSDNPLARIDSNNDQYIAKGEADAAYKSIAYLDGVKDIKQNEFVKAFGSSTEAQNFFNTLDKNADGTVAHGEWLNHFKSRDGFGDYEYGGHDTKAKGNSGGHGGGDGGGHGGGGGGGGGGDNFLGQLPPELLKLFDKDGDGILDPDEATELERVYKQTAENGGWNVKGLMAAGMSQQDAMKVVAQMDSNGNGTWDHGAVKQLVKSFGGDVNVSAGGGGGNGGGGY